MNDQELFNAARIAGELAVQGKQDGYPCGFAWITIKPARGKFVNYLKSQGIGRRATYGGYALSSYDTSSFSGQNMDVKQDGCEAFAEVLRANGVDCSVETRID